MLNKSYSEKISISPIPKQKAITQEKNTVSNQNSKSPDFKKTNFNDNKKNQLQFHLNKLKNQIKQKPETKLKGTQQNLSNEFKLEQEVLEFKREIELKFAKSFHNNTFIYPLEGNLIKNDSEISDNSIQSLSNITVYNLFEQNIQRNKQKLIQNINRHKPIQNYQIAVTNESCNNHNQKNVQSKLLIENYPNDIRVRTEGDEMHNNHKGYHSHIIHQTRRDKKNYFFQIERNITGNTNRINHQLKSQKSIFKTNESQVQKSNQSQQQKVSSHIKQLLNKFQIFAFSSKSQSPSYFSRGQSPIIQAYCKIKTQSQSRRLTPETQRRQQIEKSSNNIINQTNYSFNKNYTNYSFNQQKEKQAVSFKSQGKQNSYSTVLEPRKLNRRQSPNQVSRFQSNDLMKNQIEPVSSILKKQITSNDSLQKFFHKERLNQQKIDRKQLPKDRFTHIK